MFQLFPRTGTEAERLVRRYLDPRGSWSVSQDARMRSLLRDDDAEERKRRKARHPY